MTDIRLQIGTIRPGVQRHLTALDSAAERAAAEAGIPDDVYQRAAAALTEQQFAAIAWTITAMNAWNRVGVLGHMQPPPLA